MQSTSPKFWRIHTRYFNKCKNDQIKSACCIEQESPTRMTSNRFIFLLRNKKQLLYCHSSPRFTSMFDFKCLITFTSFRNSLIRKNSTIIILLAILKPFSNTSTSIQSYSSLFQFIDKKLNKFYFKQNCQNELIHLHKKQIHEERLGDQTELALISMLLNIKPI